MSEHNSTFIRAVAYYRKSNTDDGKSVAQQREWALNACKVEGLDLAAEHTDQAKPGHETARRTEFLRMIEFYEAEANAGRPVGAVVCWAADRFSRSDSFETGAFIWRLMQAGVGRMLTATEGWIDFADANARIIFNVTQDTGRHQYVRQLAQATLRGRIDSAKKGRWMNRAPWGYRLDADAGRLMPYPETSPHARWIFEHYADAEDGVLRIAQALTERGVPSPSAKGPWTANAVHCVLRNPAYLGDTVFGKRVSGKFFAMLDLRPAPRPGRFSRSPANA
jgi:DNA invertase Pin-like site-specific DNA recombinase